MPVAEFSCRNATGKRLTSKNGKVKAKPWFAQVKITDETQTSKYKFVKGQVGYAIKSGETITTKIIVIVPKGERPVVTAAQLTILKYDQVLLQSTHSYAADVPIFHKLETAEVFLSHD